MQHIALFPSLLLLLLLLAPADGELLLAYSIQRHGARNVLPKSALLTESDAPGGPTLLPAGKQMCFDAGIAFSRRYISRPTCGATCLSTPSHEQYGVVNTPGVGFHNYNSFANSSALDRAILSGNFFLAGVFASKNSSASLQGAVPLYSISDSEDWRIRGYSKCPTYQQRLAAWLKSDGFRQKEQETAALRAQVQAIAPQLNTSLAQWWDVYDAFNVWRTWGVGSPLPAIDNDTFAQITELAMWLETSKMDPSLTGNLLGGGLLGDVLHRMAAAEAAYQANSQALYYKLLTVSSHYNTQLGLLSALQSAVPAAQRTQYLWLSRIPSLAAVLVLELHASSSSGQLVVRAVFQDGPKGAYTTLPLPCAEAGDAAEAVAGPGACTLDAFRRLAEPAAMFSVGEWCEACDNSKVMACAVRSMERQLKEVGVDPQAAANAPSATRTSSTKGKPVSPGMVAVWCVVSVAAAALLACAGFLVARRARGRSRKHGGALSHSLAEATGVQSLHQSAPV